MFMFSRWMCMVSHILVSSASEHSNVDFVRSTNDLSSKYQVFKIGGAIYKMTWNVRIETWNNQLTTQSNEIEVNKEQWTQNLTKNSGLLLLPFLLNHLVWVVHVTHCKTVACLIDPLSKNARIYMGGNYLLLMQWLKQLLIWEVWARWPGNYLGLPWRSG